MENFLSNFANANTEVKSSNAKLSVSTEFWGSIELNKGLLYMSIDFYSRLYKTRYENCISLDDWGVNEINKINFNGIVIDDIEKLKDTMRNSGLSTMAYGLNIDDKDIKLQIAYQIQSSKLFKAIYGKSAIMLDCLTEEEQKIKKLEYVIKNYDNKALVKHDMSLFLIEDEEGGKVEPSYGKLMDMYKELTNN
jgi:hypothetical protein